MFQFTHPGRGATVVDIYDAKRLIVSIHAPREGCDTYRRALDSTYGCFNSRTPGGVRLYRWSALSSKREFQFTHPGRGATTSTNMSEPLLLEFQFTHPGRGATHRGAAHRSARPQFQFTHPGRGATSMTSTTTSTTSSFNSRTPGGVRRQRQRTQGTSGRVSIHAPREGCDPTGSSHSNVCSISFNSRTPGGVRRSRTYNASRRSRFQFTHPGRGATSMTSTTTSTTSSFNSRTPGGVRPARRRPRRCGGYVSIHAPREGCDTAYRNIYVRTDAFQFTHPGRGATCDIRAFSS